MIQSPMLIAFVLLVLLAGGAVVLSQQYDLGPQPPASPGGGSAQTLDQYYASLDTSCQSDADCVVKDVHNCCGYYPQCVNRNAQTDPELVNRLCTSEERASICGFEEIESCLCVQNKCQSSGSKVVE